MGKRKHFDGWLFLFIMVGVGRTAEQSWRVEKWFEKTFGNLRNSPSRARLLGRVKKIKDTKCMQFIPYIYLSMK